MEPPPGIKLRSGNRDQVEPPEGRIASSSQPLPSKLRENSHPGPCSPRRLRPSSRQHRANSAESREIQIQTVGEGAQCHESL
jgi:hypothetical protein